jgi:hypothetical protein
MASHSLGYGAGGIAMKAFIAACVAIIVIAVGAAVVLEKYQKPADHAYATSGARI